MFSFPIHRHSTMAADLTVAARVLHHDDGIHYTMAFSWLGIIRRNSAWGFELSQTNPLTQKLKNKRHNFGSWGQLQLVYRCNISLTLTQIWEISPMYTVPQALYHIMRFILMFHHALHISTEARSRWHSLLTIFSALFGPRGLLPTLFNVSGYVSPLSTIHSTNLHGGSTKHVA